MEWDLGLEGRVHIQLAGVYHSFLVDSGEDRGTLRWNREELEEMHGLFWSGKVKKVDLSGYFLIFNSQTLFFDKQ